MRRARSGLAWGTASMLLMMSTSSFAEPAAEDKASAEALFVAGTKLMTEGKFTEACPKLAESVRIDPGVGTMLYLADCYEKTKRVASAWAQFREAEDVALKQHDSRAEVARRRADKLEPVLPRLVITVPPASDAAGIEVKRDGVVVGRAQWRTAVPLDAGPHAITATAPQKKAWETKIDVPPGAGGAAVTVPPLDDLPAPVAAAPVPVIPASPPSAVSPEEDPNPGKTQRVVGLGVGGAGVVTAVIGLVVGLGARSTYGESNASAHCTGNVCDAFGLQRRTDAFAAARTATVLTIAGGLAAAGGAVLFFTAPHRSTAIAVAPAGGPTSARLDLRLSW